MLEGDRRRGAAKRRAPTSGSIYNFGTRVETSTSAVGRVTSSLFDAQGKVLQIARGDVLSETRADLEVTAFAYRSSPKAHGDACDRCLTTCLANMGKWWFLGDPWPAGCGGV